MDFKIVHEFQRIYMTFENNKEKIDRTKQIQIGEIKKRNVKKK